MEMRNILCHLWLKLRLHTNEVYEVPNVIFYIIFIMHPSYCYNANIYLFNWIVCHVCNREDFCQLRVTGSRVCVWEGGGCSGDVSNVENFGQPRGIVLAPN